MKKLLFIIPLLLYIACNNNSTSTNSSENVDKAANDSIKKELTAAYKNAKNSPIIETKLFGAYTLGMTEQETDEVFLEMGRKGQLHDDDCPPDYNTIFVEDTFLPYKYSYEYRDDNDYYYIKFDPEFLEGKLTSLLCWITPSDSNTYNGPTYKRFAEMFESSPRAKGFTKFVTSYTDSTENTPVFNDITFIKDNLCISFYDQPESKKSTIQYTNVPDAEKYLMKTEAEAEANKSYNDL